ncbi:hypothetical protein RF11_08912 [Thelohanellus kitauei]|uniref:Uncharacterized protein n=1 Tax=Thelohanellus kitauei TaxID=669202 RepID=A0A0C2NLT7_THEKT|nr:hypothetical protein RF11_08912 [Thelohanellus kitauei]
MSDSDISMNNSFGSLEFLEQPKYNSNDYRGFCLRCLLFDFLEPLRAYLSPYRVRTDNIQDKSTFACQMDHLKPEECKDYLFICLDLTAWKEVKALKLDMLPYAELVSNLKERFDVPYD